LPITGLRTAFNGASAYRKPLNDWLRITSVLNDLCDSMSQAPFYPFTLAAPVVAKLQLVHEVIADAADHLADN
jgi:hypothetical protein